MTDYISREAVRLIESDSEAYAEAWNAPYEQGFCDGINAVLELPAADVVEVVHGAWINAYPDIEPNPMFMYGICSQCGFEQSISDKLNYCPNCGAKMDGGDHNALD